MHYRLYRPDDFAALYAIEVACFEPPFRFSRNTMRQIIASRNAVTWIAEQDSKMAGFAVMECHATRGTTTAYIQTLEVLPAHRGHGAGAQLLHHMETSARAVAAQLIWLHVDVENVSAIRLYTSSGFQPQGREENYYPQGRPALVFNKIL